MNKWLLGVCAMVTLVGCSAAPGAEEIDDDAGLEQPVTRTPSGAAATTTTPSNSSSNDAGTAAAADANAAGPRGPVPKLLARGFGKDFDAFIGGARTFDDFKKLLNGEGFDPKDAIDLGNYDDSKSMAEMTAEVGAMLEAAMQRYPEGTKFDVMGHSLGGIVALRGILEKNLASRVRTFVALSAPIYGQDKKPFNCTLGIACGDIYDFYSPFNSPKILDYMKTHESKLNAMKLCSLIGPDDGTITSPMAGAQFTTGTNVVVPGVDHIAIIRNAPALKALKDQCFGGSF